jgi:DNA-binding transcriptional LysR family regulator
MEFPQLDFHLVEYYDADLIEKVYDKEIDLAFVALPQNHPFRNSLHCIPLYEEQIFAVVKQGHKLAKKGFATIADLAKYNLVFASTRSILYKMISEAFEANGKTPESIISISKHDIRLPLVMNNMISFGLSKQGQWSKYSEVVLIPLKPAINMTSALIFPKDYTPSPELDVLIQTIQEDVIAHYKRYSIEDEE